MAADLVKLISEFTTVISYTHAGLDFTPDRKDSSKLLDVLRNGSKPADSIVVDPPPTSELEAQELAALLNELRINDDVVLVSYHVSAAFPSDRPSPPALLCVLMRWRATEQLGQHHESGTEEF